MNYLYIYLFQIFDKFFKQANPTQQHGDIHSSDLNMGSQHVLQTDNDKRHKPPNRQMYLCNCMYLHSQRTPLATCLFSSSSNPTSTFGQNQLYLSWDPLGFAYYTSAFGGFMNNSNGESSADSSQVEKVFKEDACDYCVDDLADQIEMDFSTLLANGMCQNFPPLLPVPLLPSDKKDANFGDEGQQIDEVFYPPNGTQRFSDEDLKIWLSRVNPRYECAHMFMNIYYNISFCSNYYYLTIFFFFFWLTSVVDYLVMPMLLLEAVEGWKENKVHQIIWLLYFIFFFIYILLN